MPQSAQSGALECPGCLLAGAEGDEAAEAAQLAGTHDDLLHRGRPTTVLRRAAAPVGGLLLEEAR